MVPPPVQMTYSDAMGPIPSTSINRTDPEVIHLRQDVQEMRKKIVSLETQLMGWITTTDTLIRETKRMNWYNYITETIRKWNMRYSGDYKESIEDFLRRIEQHCHLAGLNHDDILPFLSPLFTGLANIWYRTRRDQWRTWEKFCKSARKWFGDDSMYQEFLENEVEARAQDQGESVREYFIKLTYLMSMLSPSMGWDDEEKLYWIHRNMHPDIRENMPLGKKYNSVEKLLKEALNAELIIEFKKMRPSPPPELLAKYRTSFPDEAKSKSNSENSKQGNRAPQRKNKNYKR